MVLFNSTFDTSDSSNWQGFEWNSQNPSGIISDGAGFIEFDPQGLDILFTRPLGSLTNGHNEIRVAAEIVLLTTVNAPQTETLFINVLNQNGSIIYSASVSDSIGIATGGASTLAFDRFIKITNTSANQVLTLELSSFSPNLSYRLNDLTVESREVDYATGTKCYFSDESIFNTTNSVDSNVSSFFDLKELKIDNVETLTPDFFIDNGITSTTSPRDDYHFCSNSGPGGTYVASPPFTTYNFFEQEFGLLFNYDNGFARGKAQGTLNGKNYGSAILELGVDKDLVLNVNDQFLKGAFFVSFDFDKSFKMVFDFVFNSNSANVMDNPDINRTYTIEWNRFECFSKFSYVDNNDNGTEYNITNNGFLTGLEDPKDSESPRQYDFSSFCTIVDPNSDCEINERTISYALGLSLPEQSEDKDIIFKECCYTHIVFGYVDNLLDRYRNDYSGFFHKRQLPNETCEFYLLDVKNSNEINFNTLNVNIGDFGTHIDADLKTLQFSWGEILQEFGEGSYNVVKRFQIAGIDFEEYSETFTLRNFSTRLANGTARAECIMNGRFDESGVDFTGVNFMHSVRTGGFFGNRDFNIEEDNIVSKTLEKRQISIKQINEYKFQTDRIPSCIANQIIDFIIFGNQLSFSDYNLNNNSYGYKSFPVKYSNNDGTVYGPYTRKSVLNLVFTDAASNKIKRNY
jgi:hypothetical protein